MQFLRDALDRAAPLFEKGGKYHKLHAFYEAPDTLLFTPADVTRGRTHIRDGMDLKRMMVTVVGALVPAILFAMYNTGLQANRVIAQVGEAAIADDWNTSLFELLMGWFGAASPVAAHDPSSLLANVLYGACYFVPVLLTTFVVGGHIEMLTAVVRKHEVNEGFLVTGFLFPLILPPTIPLWQVAVGIAFGVLIGKEVFGGTGMNVLNPALTARAFLFFAYPAQISGDKVWTAVREVDGFSGATWLGRAAAEAGALDQLPWLDAFLGFIPGSMGETSALAALLGAGVLIATRIGAWRTMVGVAAGTIVVSLLLNAVGSDTNPMMAVPFWWHMVLGGWAFGTVFMATDPVSSAFTNLGRLMYGFGIGALVVLVRVVNPAYPEGMMLAILFMNLFAPLFDHFVVQANIKRRLARSHVATRHWFTIAFAAGVCLVCSLFGGAAVALKDTQEQNKVLDKQKKVLSVAQLIEEGAAPSAEQVRQLFDEKIEPQVIDMKTGARVAEAPFDVKSYDQKKASKDPAASFAVDANKAKVGRVANHAIVYCVKAAGGCDQYILPVEGKGLWSTLYGFLSLDKDGETIRGITFYEHGETPGLGGEVDNPKWKALWPGRKAFDSTGKVAIRVVKGKAGDVATAPNAIDGLSGATLTSNGVTHLVQFWLGEQGFGPYLKNLKSGRQG